ncbi:SDR family NAD(P)-dependent oxidoreductase [Niveibacterium sp. SC-1]|uniref:SDR family NAD(P)-dependent oxidoreductase n=1 Tax=Niveibacterium sp. SC-1 TaxID=3135646 RepID=UPI00311F7A07
MSTPTVFIAGASRGLGLEFARQYAIAGWRVIAGVRNPLKASELMRVKGAEVVPLDVTSANAIAGAAWHADEAPLDLLIINAGVYGPDTTQFAAPGDEDFNRVMHTNVLGPIRLIQVFGDAVAQARGKIVALSSGMGSIANTSAGDHIVYRASKAALNMVVQGAAQTYGPRGVTVLSISPGWVRTDMGGPAATLEAYDSVRAMRSTIEATGEAEQGAFLNYDGKRIAW